MEKNNKLIAEFMGLDTEVFNSGKVNYYYYDKVSKQEIFLEAHELSYNVSWDWLMPVIEKIESLGYEVQIRSTDCIIFQLLDTLDYKPVIGTISSASGKMYSTYIAVVEFIKEYNQNN